MVMRLPHRLGLSLVAPGNVLDASAGRTDAEPAQPPSGTEEAEPGRRTRPRRPTRAGRARRLGRPRSRRPTTAVLFPGERPKAYGGTDKAVTDTDRARLQELSALQRERPLFRDELDEVADLFEAMGNSTKARQARNAAARAPEREDVPFALTMPSPAQATEAGTEPRPPAGYGPPRASLAAAPPQPEQPALSRFVTAPPSAQPQRSRAGGGQGWRSLVVLLGGVIFVLGVLLWCGNVFGFYPTVPLAGYLTMCLGAGIAKVAAR